MPSAKESPSSQARRPKAMTAFCVYLFIGAIVVSATNIIPGYLQTASLAIQSWLPAYLVGFSIITIICGIGLWNMKRWAFISYSIVILVNQIVQVIADDWQASNLIVVIGMHLVLYWYYPRQNVRT